MYYANFSVFHQISISTSSPLFAIFSLFPIYTNFSMPYIVCLSLLISPYFTHVSILLWFFSVLQHVSILQPFIDLQLTSTSSTYFSILHQSLHHLPFLHPLPISSSFTHFSILYTISHSSPPLTASTQQTNRPKRPMKAAKYWQKHRKI